MEEVLGRVRQNLEPVVGREAAAVQELLQVFPLVPIPADTGPHEPEDRAADRGRVMAQRRLGVRAEHLVSRRDEPVHEAQDAVCAIDPKTGCLEDFLCRIDALGHSQTDDAHPSFVISAGIRQSMYDDETHDVLLSCYR